MLRLKPFGCRAVPVLGGKGVVLPVRERVVEVVVRKPRERRVRRLSVSYKCPMMPSRMPSEIQLDTAERDFLRISLTATRPPSA
jgi:hypothetical protein